MTMQPPSPTGSGLISDPSPLGVGDLHAKVAVRRRVVAPRDEGVLALVPALDALGRRRRELAVVAAPAAEHDDR